jgi:TetR/AcrR family transcriptional repressor of nem operon
MRYSQDHKAQTHQRIIKAGFCSAFASDGIGATGLQPLMKALGLTHGGFYSHFKSKDELVEKALQEAGNQVDGLCAEIFARGSTRLMCSSRRTCPNGTRRRPMKAARC